MRKARLNSTLRYTERIRAAASQPVVPYSSPSSVNSQGHQLSLLTVLRLAFILALITIAYNVAEGVVSTWLGIRDETLALFGFGLDSFIESVSGAGIALMIVRLRRAPGHSSARSRSEQAALRVTGVSFFGLAVLLTASATLNIIAGHEPDSTFWGIIIASVSIVTMMALYAAKLHVGRKLNSAPIIADARCTLVCLYMSGTVLLSSVLYSTLSVGYVDSLGAFVLAAFSVTEGRECFQKVRGIECSCTYNAESAA